MSDSELGLQVPPGSTWVCSPIDVEWHEDWDAFHAYMDGYQEITHQVFRQRTSVSMRKRNQEISGHLRPVNRGTTTPDVAARSSTAAGGAEEETMAVLDLSGRLVPQAFDNFWIKLALTWNDAESTYLVRVTGFDDVHKHQVFKTIFEKLVSNRRVENPNLLAFVDELQAAGSKPKWIMQFLRKKTGKNATLRDVHNLVVRMKEKRRGAPRPKNV
ncbi:hypothetical protein PI124_g15864 [Phytophthora idaei]|nr:hypothetical protein PI125_g17815 [Phytophthora idaei]KAG3139123.1 hypothetical protein PI126_g16611 [Phytophthora idaei]KAG3239191.1 hypothetical protein PI124_g15864 [Phytophthora idaei]